MNPIRIATRRSALALWQAEHVAARLRRAHPGREVVLLPMTTRGDRILDRPLAEIGGKGLFLKELEVAMQAGEADIAVHSMKDVPMQLEPGFAMAAILERADPHDAFVSNDWPGLASLPPGARVGTSSMRRRSLLRALRPDLQVDDLRGNVNTRLARLDQGEFAAIILACAGLIRLGFEDRIRDRLPAPEWLPAVAQGAIGIEVREGDHDAIAAVAPLVHADTTTCVSAERAMNRVLQGSCDVPIAGHALLDEGTLRLEGLVGDPDDGRLIRARGSAPAADAEALGERVAAELLALGAERVLRGRRHR